ncbi:hypothetical protein [uncultured Roseobacter sp.]|nr:hypothetical protein [uncultured Roseobacter sp.]
MKKTVQGISAPAPRLTKTAAFLIATGMSIPVFAVLTLVEWLWF